ncbi:hypothetical protein AM228_02075 [Planktothricoides sp. SR001]|uniref:hypothetical protein n=1 Tax=Planktothricoides sp. SR001 TaxID=1705388 RepID=UPI0006C43531|nr:hypothetical protein [Planktothricoides sp. SR001]KOR38368.1 hypothetical protein AM228_02075 [Planktothricoides sp. SR001]
MTVEEALAIVETALDYDRLNHVQEILFRQSWAGLSYREIAKNSGYDPDYLKDAGSKLWKELSKVFGEKVKKDNLQSVLRRYLKRNQITLQRNQIMGVDLTGSNLSGAKLLFANISKDSCQADLYKDKIGDNKTEVDEPKIKAEDNSKSIAHSPSETITYSWKSWQFRSAAEANIAQALDRSGVLFFPKATARLTTTDGRENQDLYFLICYEGKLGILGVNAEEGDEADRRSDRILQSQGIRMIQYYNVNECTEEPDRVVLEFLQNLSFASKEKSEFDHD